MRIGHPKIHKEKAPLWTIVSGLNTATERIAELAEHELNKFVEPYHVFSGIQPTSYWNCTIFQSHFQLTVSCFVLTFRNSTLSFPKKEGLDACREALEKSTRSLVNSIDERLEVITTVLYNNNLSLGESLYTDRGCSSRFSTGQELHLQLQAETGRGVDGC